MLASSAAPSPASAVVLGSGSDAASRNGSSSAPFAAVMDGLQASSAAAGRTAGTDPGSGGAADGPAGAGSGAGGSTGAGSVVTGPAGADQAGAGQAGAGRAATRRAASERAGLALDGRGAAGGPASDGLPSPASDISSAPDTVPNQGPNQAGDPTHGAADAASEAAARTAETLAATVAATDAAAQAARMARLRPDPAHSAAGAAASDGLEADAGTDDPGLDGTAHAGPGSGRTSMSGRKGGPGTTTPDEPDADTAPAALPSSAAGLAAMPAAPAFPLGIPAVPADRTDLRIGSFGKSDRSAGAHDWHVAGPAQPPSAPATGADAAQDEAHAGMDLVAPTAPPLSQAIGGEAQSSVAARPPILATDGQDGTRTGATDRSTGADRRRGLAEDGPASAPAPPDASAANGSAAAGINQRPPVASPSPPTPGSLATSAPQARGPTDQLAPALIALGRGADGGHRLTLHLQPEELGQVDVRIDRAATGEARVEITVERPETLRLMLHDQPRLERALDQAGIPAEGRSLVLHVAAPDQGGNVPNGGSGQSQGQGQGNGSWASTTGGGPGGQPHAQGGRSGHPPPFGSAGGGFEDVPPEDGWPAPAALRWHRAGIDITA